MKLNLGNSAQVSCIKGSTTLCIRDIDIQEKEEKYERSIWYIDLETAGRGKVDG